MILNATDTATNALTIRNAQSPGKADLNVFAIFQNAMSKAGATSNNATSNNALFGTKSAPALVAPGVLDRMTSPAAGCQKGTGTGTATPLTGGALVSNQSAARQTLQGKLNSLLATIDQQPAGTAANAATNTSLKSLIGNLTRALQTYDPKSPSVTRSLSTAINAVSDAVDAHSDGDTATLTKLAETLSHVLPGTTSAGGANTANQATMASLLQSASDVGTKATTEAEGGSAATETTATPEAAAATESSNASSKTLTALLQQLSASAGGQTGTDSQNTSALTSLAGSLLGLGDKAGTSQTAAQLYQAVIKALTGASGTGDTSAATQQLETNLAALVSALSGTGANTTGATADLLGLQAVGKRAAQPSLTSTAGSVNQTGQPNTAGMSEGQKATYYSGMLSPGAQSDLAAGKKVVLALRNDQSPNANHGKGTYSDRMVVLSKDASGTHVTELRGNTQPSGQYGAGGVRAGNHRSDLAKLSEGTYHFGDNGSFLGDKSFRAKETEQVDRLDTRTGKFSKHDSSGAGTSLLFHRGGQDNTDSAGCQTMPPDDYARFKAAVGSGGFTYDLRNVASIKAPTGGSVASTSSGQTRSSASSGNSFMLNAANTSGSRTAPGGVAAGGATYGGLSSNGLKFLFAHEVGKMVECPSANSGVTVGAGYDMKEKSAATIKKDFLAAGASQAQAELFSKAAGLSGSAAKAFVDQHSNALNGLGTDFMAKLIQPELKEIGSIVDKMATRKLTTGQRDAVMSFAFNLGSGVLKKSGIMDALNRGDTAAAIAILNKYVKTGPETSKGLIARRHDEAKLMTA